MGLEGSGAFGARVQKVQRVQRVVVGRLLIDRRRPLMKKPLQPPCGRGNAFPLWWLAPPPFPRKRGHYGCLAMEPCLCRKHRNLFCPLNRGKSGAARIGGGERSEPVSRMLIMPYGTARSSRNADFILIARKGDTTTLGPKGRQTYEPSLITLTL